MKFKEALYQDKEDIGVDTFHTHLEIDDNNKIELLIFYEEDVNYFDHIIVAWIKKVNWSNIGNYFEVLEFKDEDVLSMDFKESNIIGFQTGITDKKLNKDCVSIEIDFVKLEKKPNEERVGKGEFFLNNNGFNFVSEYYTGLRKQLGKQSDFTFKRSTNLAEYYEFENIKFTPKFYFYSNDSRNENQAIINKVPYIDFSFDNSTKPNLIDEVFNFFILAVSFYYKQDIQFKTSKIYLKDKTIVSVKNKKQLTKNDTKDKIWPIYKEYDVNKFILKVLGTKLKDVNAFKLNLIVRKFFQSELVDLRSSILLNFSILEICKSEFKNTDKPEQFNFISEGNIITKKNRNKVLREAKDIILQYIDINEKKHFEDKWTSSIDKIITKPMRSPFMKFLEDIGFKTEVFEMEFSKIKSIRDSITHGSTDTFSEEELLVCNQMLYRISIGLILNHLQIKDWSEKVEMKLLN